jgi:uncharacterized protein YegL
MTVDYVNNPNQRTPCVLVLDASYSMSSRTKSGKTRIEHLNEGLHALEDALKSDPIALTRVQISIVIVGGPNSQAELLMDWTDANHFTAFDLKPAGNTPLAEGLQLGLELAEEGKNTILSNGVSLTRPWMIVISDGDPTSSASAWKEATLATREAETNNKVEIFPIAVEGASIEKMNQISHKPCAQLSGMKFKELFVWISDSMSKYAQSRPGDNITLPNTDPWRDVGL